MLITRDKLTELAALVGVSQVGVTTAEPLYYMQDRLRRRINEGRITPFEEKNPTRRLSPDHLLAQCRSIITLAIPYASVNPLLPGSAEGLRGVVARCARSIDYHHFVGYKAENIVSLIKKNVQSTFNYRILCDRSPLVERELAFNAGLGRIGENCTLINTQYGSYTALGTILLDVEITADNPIDQACNNCGKCRNACPTGAITEPFVINPYRCLSYLTQAAGIFPRELRPQLGKQIYGCDHCQEACPDNLAAECSPFPELAYPLFPAEPLLIPLLTITQREFDLTIGLTSAGWRGKTTLQRNAVIALGNSGDRSAVPSLARLLENDSRPLIRLHAAWALGRIGEANAYFALEKSQKKDPDPAVREEADLALKNCN